MTITIKMPQELLDKWLSALESGKYKQTQAGFLEYNGSYCCLGVLQMEADGKVERDRRGGAGLARPAACAAADYGVFSLPSPRWLKSHGIEFTNGDTDIGAVISPWLPSLNYYAHEANDEGTSFKDIAAAIRKCSEGT